MKKVKNVGVAVVAAVALHHRETATATAGDLLRLGCQTVVDCVEDRTAFRPFECQDHIFGKESSRLQIPPIRLEDERCHRLQPRFGFAFWVFL